MGIGFRRGSWTATDTHQVILRNVATYGLHDEFVSVSMVPGYVATYAEYRQKIDIMV